MGIITQDRALSVSNVSGAVATIAAGGTVTMLPEYEPRTVTVKLTITELVQAVVNGTEHQGTKIFTFPPGHISIIGCIGSLQQTTTSALASTLNASSTGRVSLGTATSANTSLNGADANVAAVAFTSSATIDVAGTAVKLASTALLGTDGSATAAALYLNSAFATTGDVDADATQKWNGTLYITYIVNGDY